MEIFKLFSRLLYDLNDLFYAVYAHNYFEYHDGFDDMGLITLSVEIH